MAPWQLAASAAAAAPPGLLAPPPLNPHQVPGWPPESAVLAPPPATDDASPVSSWSHAGVLTPQRWPGGESEDRLLSDADDGDDGADGADGGPGRAAVVESVLESEDEVLG